MAVTREQVAELYVADFNRAPDSAGLDYWVASGLAIEEISASFFDQAETKTMYPDTMSDSIFVNTIYQNVFNRDADADGLVYWEEQLASGSVTRANMILAIVNGAQNSASGQDQTILDNKTEVGLYYANAGLNDVEEATTVMSGVDDTQESVVAAKLTVDSTKPITSFSLTTAADTIAGSSGDDTISGSVTTGIAATDTYNDGDTINGGDGDDTLNLSIGDDSSSVSIPVAAVETIKMTVAAASMVSAKNWSGVDAIELLQVTNKGNTIQDIKEEIESVKIESASDGAVEKIKGLAASDTTLYSGSSDSLDLTLSKSAGTIDFAVTDSVGTAGRIENYNVNVTGSTGDVTLKFAGGSTAEDSTLKSVTITGDNGGKILDFTPTATTKSSLTSVDASGLDGDFNFISKNDYSSLQTLTVKGAKGNDVITATETSTVGLIALVAEGNDGNDTINGASKNDTLSGGKGDDELIGNNGNDTIDGGDGNDTQLDGGAGNDTINGGAGNDTIDSGTGDDQITGGTGKDSITLTANNGSDTIIFNGAIDSGTTTSSADTITNFGTGVDKLSFLTVASATQSNFISVTTGEVTLSDAVIAVNGNELSGKVYLFDTSTNSLMVDVDGDGIADTAVNVGINNLVYTDIL